MALIFTILATAGLLVYTWVLYPALLTVLAARRRRPPPPAPLPFPSISVVLAAHNEAESIAARVQNLLACEKPDRWEVLIGVDGSSDATAENARKAALGEERVKVFAFTERRGKVGVIKELVQRAIVQRGKEGRIEREKTEIFNFQFSIFNSPHLLVFTDANTVFAPDAVSKLLRHFDDPKVGGVCGRLVLGRGQREKFKVQSSKGEEQSSKRGDQGEGIHNSQFTVHNSQSAAGSTRPGSLQSLPPGEDSPRRSPESGYWNWEARLKEMESSMDSCLGANGAIYAVRRELFWQDVPTNTIIDDFVLGMKVREQGYRMVYEPEALAFEELPELRDEWRRRVRIGAGDFQALKLCWRCLLPRYGWFAWSFWSHKVLRWFTPIVGGVMVLGSGFGVLGSGLGGGGWGVMWLPYAVVAGSVVGAVCVLAGRWAKGESTVARFCRLCDHFVTMQAAIFVGFLKFCRGGLQGAWDRTPRGMG